VRWWSSARSPAAPSSSRGPPPPPWPGNAGLERWFYAVTHILQSLLLLLQSLVGVHQLLLKNPVHTVHTMHPINGWSYFYQLEKHQLVHLLSIFAAIQSNNLCKKCSRLDILWQWPKVKESSKYPYLDLKALCL
jgi:hypothetical protein